MSGRKSSIDPSRRLSQRKAYIPYRDYDPDVGKRTGVVVRRVERHSDGFEPFDDVLDQADILTPPPKSRPNKRNISIIADEFDENGEMSMDIDSPQPIFATTGLQQSPSVPIPSTSHRKAMTIRDLDDSSQDMKGSPHHVTHDDGADDELNLTNHAPSSVTRRKSFSQINSGSDDDDEDGDELLSNKSPSRKPPSEEREVAHGLDDISEEDEEGEEEDHQQEQELEEPPLKKARTKTLVQTLTRRKKENQPVPEGVRRSQRESIRPLEW
ncbi:hypothetical protein FISHEDRAFT_75224 [Fistulina hepatica ATCC 64428]|uniref:Uncharacterized protein n=1 Tax=Fistulina hepatica ATCC 64428 TaxID=1128425 RepID=A0A0D7A825_9AGAR|nr:hypothetical protein FISHEDRAFT_75224 [Fistulina hepatica ATCC 64428]